MELTLSEGELEKNNNSFCRVPSIDVALNILIYEKLKY